MFYNETRYVEAILQGGRLCELDCTPIQFGPLKTDTHTLGSHGWVLRMYQSTPLHIKLTRPKISISPVNCRDFGFRWKMRARKPYTSEEEILKDISNTKAERFSISKYETKHVPVQDAMVEKTIAKLNGDIESLKRQLASSERIIQDMIRADDEESDWGRNFDVSDVFDALKEWNEIQITSMDFSKPVEKEEKSLPSTTLDGDGDNIINFVEFLKFQYDSSEIDEIVKKAMGGG